MKLEESIEVCPCRRGTLCFCSLKAALLGVSAFAERTEETVTSGDNQVKLTLPPCSVVSLEVSLRE